MAEDKAKLLQSLRIERSAAPPPRARRRGWPVVAGIAAVLIGAAGALAFYALPDSRAERRTSEAAPQHPHPAPTAAPAVTARPRALVASGYVVARRKATVAAEITGKVVEVLIEEGMVVKEGDVVARLDSVLAERDLALAQSRADAAEAAIGAIAADLHDAERILARAQSLIARNVVSEADLTKAEARVGVLRAQLKQSQAQFATATLDAKRNADMLEKHRIRAPFNGVVVERSAQPGEMISPMSVGGFTRTGICTLVDMDSIEVEVDVNEAFIGRVQAGMAVEAVLDAYPDWTVPAAVIAVVPTANREKATVKVRIALKAKDPRILPDMAVKVTFEPAATAGDAPKDKSAAN
jgi:RND family efflux transporter MFP subunit